MKKLLSIILSVLIISSVLILPTVGVAESREFVTASEIIPDDMETNTYYFYYPPSWRNEYNAVFDRKSYDSCVPGVFWWEGPYPCINEHPHIGCLMEQGDSTDKNIFKTELPKGTTVGVSFNNFTDVERYGFDATNDKRYWLDLDLVGKDGTDYSNMIFVCEQGKYSDLDMTGYWNPSGDWFYYYGNGKYGEYKTLAEAEENDAVLQKGQYEKGDPFLEDNNEPIKMPVETAPSTETTVTEKPSTTPKPTVKPVVKVTSVSLNANSVILNRGKKTTLRATVTPSNATNKKIAWTTSNSRVATVTQSGVVTAKAKGTAYIKASALDGSKKYRQCKVAVKQPVTSVKTSVAKKTLKAKQSFYIKASAYPVSANVKTVAWSVNRKGIVKLSGTATYPGSYIKVTALKRGTVYLKATAKDGSRKCGQCKITVR